MTKKIIVNSQFIFTSAFALALSLPFCAQAEIYKYVDANGQVTYSNVKIKGAKKLDLEPADTSFGSSSDSPTKRAPAARTATPANFPKVDAGTQKQRDDSRKDILKSELESEKKALEATEKNYAEADAKPEMARGQDGKYFKNNGKHEEKMAPLRAEVEAHKRNIELLEKELNAAN